MHIIYKFNTIWHQMLFCSYFKTIIKEHALPIWEKCCCIASSFTSHILFVGGYVETALRHIPSPYRLFLPAMLIRAVACCVNFLKIWLTNNSNQSLSGDSATLYKHHNFFCLRTLIKTLLIILYHVCLPTTVTYQIQNATRKWTWCWQQLLLGGYM